MKLKNKKTGKVIKLDIHCIGGKNYESLAEISEEWEDYEEPTTYYYISDFGAIREGDVGKFVEDEIVRKEIGNYFETKEEVEKAVEKLKAVKRLKDKGFRFNKWTIPEEPKTPHIKLVIEGEMDVPDSPYDLDLLFGGEE